MKPGLSSYTYTWAVGVPGSLPASPLSAEGIIDKASENGIGTVQIADNLPLGTARYLFGECEELWCETRAINKGIKGEDSTMSMPITENGIVYFYTGFVTQPDGEQYSELVAIDPAGKGDITSTPYVKWRFREPVLQLLTPLIKEGLIYTINTKNQFFCLDAATGTQVYTRRMTAKYNSSPVYAGGNIFFTSVAGETTVMKEGRRLDIVSRNKIEGEVYATPAITGNTILIRTADNLYCIGQK